jgi:myosin protein heavy chain
VLSEELEQSKSTVVLLTDTKNQLESELDTMHVKLDEEHRQSLQWKRDKDRLQLKLNEVTQLHEAAATQLEDLSYRVSSTKTEIVQLTAALDESESKRIALDKSKKALETRLGEMEREMSSTLRNRGIAHQASEMENILREQLDKQEQVALDASARSQKFENMYNSAMEEMAREREKHAELIKHRMQLEKTVQDMNFTIANMEASTISSRGLLRKDSRASTLSAVLENEAKEKSEPIKTARQAERTIRELQFQLKERDVAKARYEDEVAKMEARMNRLKAQVEELEGSEASLQLMKRRAEREADEQKERATR